MERTARFPLTFDVELERNGKAAVKVPLVWEQAHLVRLGPYNTGKLTFSPRVHIDAAPVFSAFFETLKGAGLLQDILTYDGGYYPRLKRGVTLPKAGESKDAYGKLLSNHSRGTALDLNAKWNPMGTPGAAAGGEGSVHRIYGVASKIRVEVETHPGHFWDAGIVCGADWLKTSCDAQHFELGTWEAA